MAFYMISKKQFAAMKALEKLDLFVVQQRKIKKELLDSVIEAVDYINWSTASKTLKVLDKILYSGADRGFSFNGKETLMKKCECGSTTVDNANRILKDSGEVIFVYLPNSNKKHKKKSGKRKSNSAGCPVVIIKDHPNYPLICDILGTSFLEYITELESTKREEEREEENRYNERYYWLGLNKKISTKNITTSLKKINKYISHLSFDYQTVVKTVINKIEDYKNQGNVVSHVVKFTEKIMEGLRRSAAYANEKAQRALQKKIRDLSNTMRETLEYDPYERFDDEWEREYAERQYKVFKKLQPVLEVDDDLPW